MVFDKIKEIIIEQLSVEEDDITMDTHLMKDLEADSLDAVEIIMAIEDEYGIEIPDEVAEKFQTVGDLVHYVENEEVAVIHNNEAIFKDYDILVNGADISEMEIAYAPKFTKKYNEAIAKELGVTIPEGYEAIKAE